MLVRNRWQSLVDEQCAAGSPTVEAMAYGADGWESARFDGDCDEAAVAGAFDWI